MESILTSIKEQLGIMEEYTHFDRQIIMHINSVFSILTQIGVGPSEGFRISDKYASWSDFLPENDFRLEDVKSYMYLKVKLLFDPPDRSAVMEATNRMINEFEFRISVTVDPYEKPKNETY